MRRAMAASAAVILIGALVASAPAQARNPRAAGPDNVNTNPLTKAVTVAGILSHERAFQQIANQNDGTRASGTPGYDASADYVARQLRRAGYDVRRQTFTFPFFRELVAGHADSADAGGAGARDRHFRVLRQWRRHRPRRADERSGHPGNPGAQQHLRL